MMKTALCMWLLPLLLLLPVTEADFPSAEEFIYPVYPVPRMRHEFRVIVEWTSSMVTGECWAHKLGWLEPYTKFTLGETKSIVTLGNECLQFTCGFSSETLLLDLNQPWSACAHGEGCFRTLPLEEVSYLLDYTCDCFVSSHQYEYYADKNGLVHGQLSIVSGFVCQKTGCCHDGKTVPAGTVTWSDACQQTMCIVSDDKRELVTTFKDHEGCVYNNQCVKVDQTIKGLIDNMCANLTCHKNTSQSTPAFHFEVVQNGCNVLGDCFAEGDTVHTEGVCKKLVCQFDSETNQYTMVDNYTGCSVNGECYAEGEALYSEEEHKQLVCQLDSETGRPNFMHNYTGCCHDGKAVPADTVTWSDACQQTKCVVIHNQSKLVTSFKDQEGCVYNNQCVRMGETIKGLIDNMCANLTCHKNISQSTPTFHFKVVQNGCNVLGDCFAEGDTIHTEGVCKKLVCQFDFETNQYTMVDNYTGCNVLGKCFAEGDTVHRENDCKKLVCQFDTKSNQYIMADKYTGCCQDGKTVPAGTVTRIDACRQTTCVVTHNGSALVTSFTDDEGCVYNTQCVKVGNTVESLDDNICANLTCHKNTSQSTPTFDFEIVPNGCNILGKCFYEGETVLGEGDCKKLVCHFDFTIGQYILVYKYTGCSILGKCFYEGETVHAEGDCKKRVCHFDSNTSQYIMIDNYTGCSFNKQCYAEGDIVYTVRGCIEFICRLDPETGEPNLTQSYTGCFFNNTQCYAEGETIFAETECKKLECHFDTETGQYQTILKYSGCYMDGQCYESGQVIEFKGNHCKNLTCHVDPDNRSYNFSITYEGCYDLETGKCSYSHSETFSSYKCFSSTCDVTASGKWTTFFAGAGSPCQQCSPNPFPCTNPQTSRKGCFYGQKCFRVKTVLDINDCTQFICVKETENILWKVRALGCQGPKGCMTFGEQFVDPYTKNTYRCEYQLTGLGYVYATFYKACVMPDGRSMAVGQSFFMDDIWYTCPRSGEGLIKTYVHRAVQQSNGTRYYGIYSITGEVMYTERWYYMKVARCKMNSSYEITCDYFDQPCKTNNMSLDEAHFIGDKINQDGTECVCTQDPRVNNMPHTCGPADVTNLYLCGEKGVTGAACKDPDDPSIFRKWGELWQKSQKKLCVCHPLKREAFCSQNFPEVINVNTSFT